MATRRGLLKKSLAGAAVLAAAGAVPLALRRTRLRPTPPDLRFFTPAEYAIFAAAAERILAREATAGSQERSDARPLASAPQIEQAEHRPTPPTPAELDVAKKADGFFALLPEADGRDVKRLLALFENALFSVLLGGPARPFTTLAPDEQDAHLAAWATSRLGVRRTGFQLMKRLSCALYYGTPSTWPAIGYPGPPVELVRSVLQSRAGGAAATGPKEQGR